MKRFLLTFSLLFLSVFLMAFRVNVGTYTGNGVDDRNITGENIIDYWG